MDKNKLTKTELWTKHIQDFHKSGLSKKTGTRNTRFRYQLSVIGSGSRRGGG